MASSRPSHLFDLTPDQFVAWLENNGISAFHIIYTDGKIVASHPLLQPVGEFFLNEADDFEDHEGIFFQIGPQSRTLQSAVVHRTCRGAGAGGVRNWVYTNMEAMFRDGLRLAKGMTHKNALAGIWWGGGKGVIARNSGHGLGVTDYKLARQTVYEEYGKFMSTLRGCYVTAEDVGTSLEDMASVFRYTRHTTCIPVELGGSGNPSVPTARGVVTAIEAAFDHLGMSLAGSRIAVQGVGHVGTPLIQYLFEKNVGKIIASDVDAHRADAIRAEFAHHGDKFQLRIVDRTDLSILFEDVDAVSPCATGGILNTTTIPQIKARIVCGAANNQLLDIKKDDNLLKSRGILYVPDFLCNRMGIVNCADEFAGTYIGDSKLEKHLGRAWDNSIYNLTRQVLKQADETGSTSQEISIKLADERSRINNPLYGHRGIDIIRSLATKDLQWQAMVTAKKSN